MRSISKMDLSTPTLVLGMVICFTLPLLIVACVLVYLLWPKYKNKQERSDLNDKNTESETISSQDNAKISLIHQKRVILTLKFLLKSVHEINYFTKSLFRTIIVLTPVVKPAAIEYITETEDASNNNC